MYDDHQADTAMNRGNKVMAANQPYWEQEKGDLG